MRAVVNPELWAEKVIEEIGITTSDDLAFLEEIAWERGVLVRYENLDGAEARLVAVGKPAIMTISTNITNVQRKRFSIAHELGHFEMHRLQMPLNSCTKQQIKNQRSIFGKDSDPSPEHEANLFAAALLMPRRFFETIAIKRDPSMDLVSDLGKKFDASITSAAFRFLKVTKEPVAVVYSRKGQIKWFQGSETFEELREELSFFIDVRSRLDSGTLASRLVSMNDLVSDRKSVRSSSWFTKGDYDPNSRITEDSISMPAQESVLSLLWVDEVIEPEDDFS